MFIVFGKKAFYAIFALLLVLTAATVSLLLPPEAVETSVSAPTGKTVWVIDAGHGGEDGGAVAADGSKESDMNLAIARRLDALLVAPCTGNTLAKLARGVTDTAVTMACKAHLRNGAPLILAISTNDGLSGSAESIAAVLQRKNVYFVPFRQDAPHQKPFSLQSDFDLLGETIKAAMEGRQLQPVLL